MSVCPNTGLAVPECSCGPCLQAQLREHMPALLAAKPRRAVLPADRGPAALRPPAERERRVA